MKILLTGATGGIGTAIRELLSSEEFVTDHTKAQEIDWVIFAHGIINETQIDKTFEVNTLQCVHVTELLLSLKEVKEGIIYISSTAALGGNSKYPVYSASKAALNIYAKAMQKAHPELQFYALCPGPTRTKMWDKLGLTGNPQEPIEVAKAVKRIIDGEFKGHVVITVRNGEIVCL